jgi:pyruvate kinase
MEIKKENSHHLKRNKIIYTIDQKLNYEALEKLYKCDIDFFNIDTTSFVNVKEYHEMINCIRELNSKLKKNIGIIAELKGRKIKPIDILFPNEENTNFVLKKNTKVIITNNTKRNNLASERNELVVKVRNLHKMIAIDDKIIINDNKGCLIVEEIKESNMLTNLNWNKSRTLNDLTAEENKKENQIKKVASQVNTVLIENDGDFTYQDDIEDNYIEFDFENKAFQSNIQTINVSRYVIDQFEIQKKKTKLLRSRSSFSESKYEILCRVEYDCIYNKNTYLFVPNIDFSRSDVNLLSNREVAEIASLRTLRVNFISITITSNKDIDSLKEVLGENSKIKILASISDYRSLSYINDIVNFADAIIVSRTFQMISKDNKNKVLV